MLERFEVDPEAQHDTVLSLLPYLAGSATDESKAEYLSLRFTGFSVREACKVAGIHQRTVMRWRDITGEHYDRTFRELEQAASGPGRLELRQEVVRVLFLRNMHLMLRYDHRIISKVLGLWRDEEGYIELPTKQEMGYLNKIRGQYTPQQLAVIEELSKPEGDQSFDLTEFLLKMSQNADGGRSMEIRQTKRKDNSIGTSEG